VKANLLDDRFGRYQNIGFDKVDLPDRSVEILANLNPIQSGTGSSFLKGSIHQNVNRGHLSEQAQTISISLSVLLLSVVADRGSAWPRDAHTMQARSKKYLTRSSAFVLPLLTAYEIPLS
jgi:hypothetical protein